MTQELKVHIRPPEAADEIELKVVYTQKDEGVFYAVRPRSSLYAHSRKEYGPFDTLEAAEDNFAARCMWGSF